MAVAVVPREDNAFANDNPPPARNAVLARYRQLREISKRHHHDILKLISGDAMLQQARRLGLAQGRTLILDDMEEMSYVFDLAIYTAPPRRSRAIDRYARSAQLRTPTVSVFSNARAPIPPPPKANCPRLRIGYREVGRVDPGCHDDWSHGICAGFDAGCDRRRSDCSQRHVSRARPPTNWYRPP